VATGVGATTSADCNTQVNDTPGKLLPCIQTADLWNHMQNFQAIADANPSPADGMPSLNSGEPGYKASADYVSSVMKDAGYDVTIQTYKFTYFAYTAPPVLREVSPTAHGYTLAMTGIPGRAQARQLLPFSRPAGSSSRRHRRPARRAGARPLISAASSRAGSR